MKSVVIKNKKFKRNEMYTAMKRFTLLIDLHKEWTEKTEIYNTRTADVTKWVKNNANFIFT